MHKFRLADLPLIVKIGFAPALALLVLVAITAYAVVAQRQSAAELQRAVHVEMARTLQMQRLSERITSSHGQLYLLLTHQAGKIEDEKIEGQSKDMLDDLKAIQSDITAMSGDADVSLQPLFAKLSKQLDDTRSAVDLVSSMMTADFSAAASFVAPFETSYQQMVETLGTAVKQTQDITDRRAAESEARARASEWYMMLAGFLTFLLVALLAVFATLATRSDIGKIAQATERLAGGDNDIDLDAMARKDELGAIVSSLMIFRDNQISMVALRREQEAAQAARAAEQQQRAAEQAQVMSALAEGLDHLAKGDLKFRVTSDFPGEYLALRDDFNRATGELEATLRVITAVTASIEAETASHSDSASGSVGSRGDASLKETGAALQRALDSFRANEKRMIEMREAHEQAQAEKAREQALVVSSLADGLDKLAGGDLTYRVNAAFPEEYVALRDNFNKALHKLEDTLRAIWQVTANIQSGSGEISHAADDLSRRTEHQAATLEQTAASLDEVTATVRNTAEGALNVRESMGQAKNDAERSGSVVQGAVGAMEEIRTSAEQIAQIVGAIDEIAFQTNLLALNAGVEAARAGDAGRGFAVVAGEVRALSHRTATMAKEIKSLIMTSNTKVHQGVDLVGEAGKALSRIVSQVAGINDVISQIAASAQEQSTSLGQVNMAVNEMDNVTQQNAAMVEETTAASHSLAGEADALGRLLNRFKVNGVDNHMIAGRADKPRTASAATAPAARPTPVAKPAPKPAARTAAVATGTGGSLRRQSEEWNEF